MKILVCGGRKYSDQDQFIEVMDKIVNKFGADNIEFISGGATGADTMIIEYAQFHQIDYTVKYAKWKKSGKSAGSIRNKVMLDLNPNLVVAFPGGSGTKNMVEISRKKGVLVHEVK
jgi:hypothetical protein